MDNIREFLVLMSVILTFANIFSAMSFVGKGKSRIVEIMGFISMALFWYLAVSWHYLAYDTRCTINRIACVATLITFCLAVSAWEYRKRHVKQ